MTGPELCTEDQRWRIYELFAERGQSDISDIKTMLAPMTGGPMTDLRELTWEQAERIITVLIITS